VFGATVAALLLAGVAAGPAVARALAVVVLYDGALGTGTPDTQGFLYLTRPTPPQLAAVQTYAGGVTTLTTTLETSDQAGYFARANLMPSLDRTAGFTVSFTVQVVAEEHSASDKNGDGIGDRAGFSVILLAGDTRGVELGFWQDEVWAQEGGAAEPPSGSLFTHAEGAPVDTTDLQPYELAMQGDHYRLASHGRTLLEGPLRDYSAFGFPYTTPNFLFLGDDTSSASAIIRLAAVAVEAPGAASPTPVPSATPTAAPPAARIFLPFALRQHPQTTAALRRTGAHGPGGGEILPL
jgi:hypothetical protein